MPPEAAAALAAIDATLAGEPVDPRYAELAELALILRDERPVVGAQFAAELDERVARRFASPARPASAPRRRMRGWWMGSAAGLAAAAVAVVAVVVLAGHGGGASSSASSSAAAASAPAPRSAAGRNKPLTLAAPAGHGSVFGPNGRAKAAAGPASASSSASTASSAGSASAAGTLGTGPAPTPVPSGKRQIVQSAQLALSARPDRIDDVAQQVFNVVGNEHGIVQSSTVTSTGNPNGYANFELSIPSANLAQALAALSSLHGATVLSRSDATADITGQVGGAGQRLAEARALRRSLLKQLAAAVTTQQVNSLKLQLRDADASIASDLSTLRGLQHQVAYSRVSVTIQAVAAPPPVSHGGGFTLGRAAHDAGRVLVVVAGVALIALAVLVPLGLVAALAAWAGLALRRRRREQALDLV